MPRFSSSSVPRCFLFAPATRPSNFRLLPRSASWVPTQIEVLFSGGIGELLPKGHLLYIGTFDMNVKSKGLFRTLFFPSLCSRVFGLFGHRRFVMLCFIVFFSSAAEVCWIVRIETNNIVLLDTRFDVFFIWTKFFLEGRGKKRLI